MSAESVARWNTIPMVRDETDDRSRPSPLKRTRDQVQDGDGAESDDNVSLVSRTPSPSPQADAMDVDKYDEYNRKPEFEVITTETKIKSSNKGFAMLAKLGWVEGQPLGISGDGRVEPIPFVLKNDSTGLGKTNQDVRVIESTVSQRRGLDSERQTKETEDQRRAREESVAKKVAVRTEISTVLKAFYCELCDKQFQTVGQYDEHTNSYAHHHKARFRDMQAAQKASFGGQEEIDKRKEKERKREEKELRKLAKAVGIKMAKPSTVSTIPPPAVPLDSASAASEPKPPAPKKSGWAAIDPASTSAAPSSSVLTASSSRSGWAPMNPVSDPPQTSSGWSTVSDASSNLPPPPPVATFTSGAAPAFRTGGWTSLDTGSANSAIPPAPTVPTTPAPSIPDTPNPPPSSSRPGWSTVSALPASSSGGWNAVSQPHSTQPPSQAPASPQPAARQEASRSGWQQFKKGGGSTRRR